MWLDRVLDCFVKTFFPQKCWIGWSFEVPPRLECSVVLWVYDSAIVGTGWMFSYKGGKIDCFKIFLRRSWASSSMEPAQRYIHLAQRCFWYSKNERSREDLSKRWGQFKHCKMTDRYCGLSDSLIHFFIFTFKYMKGLHCSWATGMLMPCSNPYHYFTSSDLKSVGLISFWDIMDINSNIFGWKQIVNLL